MNKDLDRYTARAAISQITLDWACKSCHGAEGSCSQQTVKELYAEAKGYHQE